MTDETTEPAEGVVITPAMISDHEKNMAGLRKGLAAMCIAMSRIKVGKTYLAEGKENFSEFCGAHRISKTVGYRMASAGAVFEIGNSLIRENILYLDQLMPISKMATDNQIKCLHLAIEVAGGPPSKKQVEEVAARHFSWFPSARKVHDSKKSPVLERIEKGCRMILDTPLTPEEADKEFGDCRHWDNFVEALDYMKAIWALGSDETREPGSDDA